MNIFGIILIIAVAVGLLCWKKCGSCGTKKKDEPPK